MNVLEAIHPWLGYLVLAVVVAVSVMAFGRGRASREFDTSLPVLAMVLVDVQVLLGAVIYVGSSFWNAGWMLAYLHPLLALGALGAGHAAISRAREERMVDDAWRTVGQGLAVTAVLVIAAVGVGSAA